MIAEEFAQSIRNRREERGWSIYRLAKESGVNHSIISRLESGRTIPRVDNYLKLMGALIKG